VTTYLWIIRTDRNVLLQERVITSSLVMCLGIGALGCVEGGFLAISAGAPVTAAVQGTITDCGIPIAGADVELRVQQNQPGQARPVDARIGPVTTSGEGRYLIEVAPAFAVPGPANVQLRVTPEGGATQQVAAGTLELRMGRPARDTMHLNIDLGQERGAC
jgi:hypothetical protein